MSDDKSCKTIADGLSACPRTRAEADEAEERTARAEAAEALLASWEESLVAPECLASLRETAAEIAVGELGDSAPCFLLLGQLEGRARRLVASWDVRLVAEEVFFVAEMALGNVREIVRGEVFLPGLRRQPEPEELLPSARKYLVLAREALRSESRFLYGDDERVSATVDPATVDSLDLVGAGALCERLSEVGDELRGTYDGMCEGYEERLRRAEDAFAAVDTEGLERVAAKVADRFGLWAHLGFLSEAGHELGRTSARIARELGCGGDRLPPERRINLIEGSADALLSLGQALWLADIDPDEVIDAIRSKVVWAVVRGDVPLASEEANDGR